MNGKSVVEMQIPTEEVENVDELVGEGYYGSRSDAIRDIIRRGAVHVRVRYPAANYGNEKQKGAVEEKETVKENLASTLTTNVKHIYRKTLCIK